LSEGLITAPSEANLASVGEDLLRKKEVKQSYSKKQEYCLLLYGGPSYDSKVIKIEKKKYK
jgi:hypothetical protein